MGKKFTISIHNSKNDNDILFYNSIFTRFIDIQNNASNPRVTETAKFSYDQVKVLNTFCTVLYELKKHYNISEALVQYRVARNHPIGFFVYDLNDTLNNSDIGIVKFQEGHVYHFAPRNQYFSYSSICCLNKSKMVIFKAINCKKPISTLKEAIAYVNERITPNNTDSKGLIRRMNNYRHYSSYRKNDLSVCKCEW